MQDNPSCSDAQRPGDPNPQEIDACAEGCIRDFTSASHPNAISIGDVPPMSEPIEPQVRVHPTWQDLVLRRSLPDKLPPLQEVLDSLHPDAMVSGRLHFGRTEWPSRPDVIRADVLMDQVPQDHPDYYPYRDGDNLAESTLHADVLVELYTKLRIATSHLYRTYTGLDQLINYDKFNRTLVLAPDIYVLANTDIKRGDNVRSIRTWEQGVPIFVIELVSDTSLKLNLVHKLRIYARIGVSELLFWDPLEEHLSPKIQYYRLINGEYQAQNLAQNATHEASIILRGIPVRLSCNGIHIRVQSTENGQIF